MIYLGTITAESDNLPIKGKIAFDVYADGDKFPLCFKPDKDLLNQALRQELDLLTLRLSATQAEGPEPLTNAS